MQKILIVDDEKMMLKMASRILSKKYETVCASSGAEAVALFESEQPDMVLSDLLMPEMDGYELHRVLQEKSGGNVPIMFMTADESDESESYGFEIGAADYIRKPLKADVLLRRIEKILANADKMHGLKKAAEIDPMTGLLNKAASQKEIGKMCSATQGVLMIIDLDSFKLVNDIYGHNMGDKILIKFSELLKSVIRSSDLAGRIGGDEFIAYCQHIQDEDVIADKTKYLNEKLVEAAKEYMGAEMEIPLGTSIGAVFVPDEGTDFAALYKKADEALYKVKKHGKHGCAFYSDLQKHSDTTVKNNSSDLRQILGERSPAQSAYFVEFEQFKIVYRLAVRLVANYEKGIQFMQIVIENADATILDEFQNLITKTLRRSDCVTRNGKKQFLVLLMEATLEESEVVKSRLLSKIKLSDKLSSYKINFHIESI